MDFDEAREYYLSGRYLRNRLILLCLLAVAMSLGHWLGILEGTGTGSGLAGRALVLQLVVTLIVLVWIVAAALGAIGLYRWLRA